MPNRITYTQTFEKYFKRYSKKFRSLPDDLFELDKKLLENPFLGTSLGDGIYKIRLAVKSKNTGKSSGFRIITYFIDSKSNENEIKLIIIYDKSEIGDISKADILSIKDK
jgi:mRNA-degrading endonuclease RelE of RelBE toxin-antitoxin system